MGCLRIDRLARDAGALVTADGRLVAARAFVADRAAARLVGMLGTPDPQPDEALVLVPCRAVHAIGMRARAGAAFLDAHGVVLRVVDPLPRRGASCRGARAVVEAASGALALAPGDRVCLSGDRLFPHGANAARAHWGSAGRPRALSGHRGHSDPRDQGRTP
jgi:NADPH:quinone reductase-like Zn-dependent oxidoreductase